MSTKTNNKSNSGLYAPYIAARSEWDERYGSLITRARNWRWAFVLAMCLGCLQTLVLLEEMHRSHVVPFVVAVDHLGHAIGQGAATETTVTDSRMIHAQLQQFVEYSRSISSDQWLLKSRLESVFNQTQVPSQANGFLVDFYRKEDPFSMSHLGTIQVEVKNINQITPTSYEVSWVEQKRDNMGGATPPEEWKGIFALTVLTAKDDASAARNPLGIFITSISWSKVL
jgi:type IV secretion system protein VirB5